MAKVIKMPVAGGFDPCYGVTYPSSPGAKLLIFPIRLPRNADLCQCVAHFTSIVVAEQDIAQECLQVGDAPCTEFVDVPKQLGVIYELLNFICQ